MENCDCIELASLIRVMLQLNGIKYLLVAGVDLMHRIGSDFTGFLNPVAKQLVAVAIQLLLALSILSDPDVDLMAY